MKRQDQIIKKNGNKNTALQGVKEGEKTVKERAAKKSHTGYTKCEAKEMFTEEDKTSREKKKTKTQQYFRIGRFIVSPGQGEYEWEGPCGSLHG